MTGLEVYGLADALGDDLDDVRESAELIREVEGPSAPARLTGWGDETADLLVVDASGVPVSVARLLEAVEEREATNADRAAEAYWQAQQEDPYTPEQREHDQRAALAADGVR